MTHKAKPTRVLKQAITRVLNAKTETKYTAMSITNGYILGNLIGDASWRRLLTVLPPVGQGVTAQSRVGNQITPIKLRVTVQYFFQGNGKQDTQALGAVTASGLYEVRQFSVSPKGIKDANQYTNAVAAALQPKLLEVGDGTTASPYTAEGINMLYKISDENWTVNKGNKRFIMGKNNGLINQSAYDPLTTARAQNTVHFSPKLPKKLTYDDNNSVYPTNFNPLWGAHAMMLTNYGTTPSTTYDGLINPILATGQPTNPVLRYNLRAELWFKDD